MTQLIVIVALALASAALVNHFALRTRRERHARIAREWELARSAPGRDG